MDGVRLFLFLKGKSDQMWYCVRTSNDPINLHPILERKKEKKKPFKQGLVLFVCLYFLFFLIRPPPLSPSSAFPTSHFAPLPLCPPLSANYHKKKKEKKKPFYKGGFFFRYSFFFISVIPFRFRTRTVIFFFFFTYFIFLPFQ